MPHIDQIIHDALKSHAAWSRKLDTASRIGVLDRPVAEICQDSLCPLGQWLIQAQTNPDLHDLTEFHRVRDIHGSFHRAAGQIAAQVTRLDLKAAQHSLRYGAFPSISAALAKALNDLRHAA